MSEWHSFTTMPLLYVETHGVEFEVLYPPLPNSTGLFSEKSANDL